MSAHRYVIRVVVMDEQTGQSAFADVSASEDGVRKPFTQIAKLYLEPAFEMCRIEMKIKGQARECPTNPGEPTSYPDWHEWAAKKSRTHRQEQCPTCGLYHVWVPKEQPAVRR